MPRISQQGTETNTVESNGSDQEVPKQRLGFAQDLGKEHLQEIPFLLLGRFKDTCRGKDLTTVADQGHKCVCGPPTMHAGNNAGSIYRELPNSDRTTQSQPDFYCHHSPMMPNCVMGEKKKNLSTKTLTLT